MSLIFKIWLNCHRYGATSITPHIWEGLLITPLHPLMLSIRISQHFKYKPLLLGFIYLNWINLVLLEVSAYNPQARAQQAQPCPSATGPELGCPKHMSSSCSRNTSHPCAGRSSQLCCQLQLLPRLCHIAALMLGQPIPAPVMGSTPVFWEKDPTSKAVTAGPCG